MKRMIIGLDLEKEYSQISYYSDRAGEPETVSIVENQDKYLIPTPEGLLRERGKEKVRDLAEFIKSCISYLRPVTHMTDIFLMNINLGLKVINTLMWITLQLMILKHLEKQIILYGMNIKMEQLHNFLIVRYTLHVMVESHIWEEFRK